ncbi:hypothetical protein AMJ85_05240 [candidate division BRC1 bacterium SM23_51]|nr:MAG: hypothetical protein AMJ85_05240 [candidate division BRC1 bacterium SM23_51]
MVAYLAVVIGLGAWAASRSRTTEGYFLGGRAMPGWAVGLSMLGTAISSVTFLAYPGSAYEGNWSRIVPGLMLPIAALLSVWLFVPFYRRTHLTSAYEYFERRFGNWGRTYACLAFTAASAYRMGIILYLLALALRSLTGWNLWAIIIITGAIVTLYTVIGGIEAVIWTDVMQTIILVLGGLITVAVVFLTVPGGAAEVISRAWGEGKLSLHDASVPSGHYFDFNLVAVTFWVLALNGLFGNLQEMCTDQTKVQRYLAARSLRSARGALWICGVGCIPVWSLFMFVGTCLYVFYAATPAQLPPGVPNDEVFPRFILTEIPPGLGGLIIAALMAAAMSSIDSSMNGSATVLTEDIYKRHMAKGRTDRHYLVAARAVTSLCGIFMIAAAVLFAYLTESEALQGADLKTTILDIGFAIGAILAGGLGGFFLLGFLSRRSNSPGAAIGVICGVLVIAWLTASRFKVVIPENLLSPTHWFLIGAFGNLAVLLVGYVASYFFAPPPESKIQRLTWRT